MYQRIMEILVLIMDEFEDVNLKSEQMDQVSENLIERGYTEQEINTAFYWLHNRLRISSEASAKKTQIDDVRETSHRVLHSLEKRYINAEAFGYLLQLKHLKLITIQDMEDIIERIYILDFRPATIDDIRMLVQSIIFEEGSNWAGNFRSLAAHQKTETCH